MIFVYSIFNIFCFCIAYKRCNKKYNPLSLYCIVWQVSLTLHEIGLIYFNQLSMLTWFIIIITQIFLFLGFHFGYKIKTKCSLEKKEYDVYILKKQIKKWIIITLVLSAIAIVYNMIHIIKIYGFNVFDKINNIYYDRVNSVINVETIPYLSSFIYISLILIGIYLRKFGFTILSIPAFILIYMNSLSSGGRAGIVFNLIVLLSAYIFTDSDRKKINFSFKRKIIIIIGIIVFGVMVVLISGQRTNGRKLIYATDKYEATFGNDSTSIYNGIIYISAPVGTLNEFLKDPVLNFGHNSFLPFYNLLAKIGFLDKVNQYQEFYNVPMSCNVGSWLRELIEDFSIVGAILIIFVFGMINGYIYKRVKKLQTINDIVVLSAFMLIVGLSFFDWRLRTFNTWIVIIFGYLISKRISNKAIIKQDRELNENNER